MKRSLFKISIILSLVLIFTSVFTMTSLAYYPYASYNYNFYGEAVATPSGYKPVAVYGASDLGLESLANPIDIYVSPQNEIYLLDYVGTDSDARLTIFDKDFKTIKTLTTLKANGHDYKMKFPESLTVDNEGYIYICDTANRQILKLDKDKSGKIVQTIGAPNSDLFTGDFKPTRVAIAKNGSLYVICNGCLDGIMEFNTSGVFLRYFGAPDVKLTLADMLNIAWRKVYRSILGKAIDNSFVTYVPTEFENLVVDDFGFVYAVVYTSTDNMDQLFKMNFLGKNIMDPSAKSTQKISSSLSRTYGDLVRRVTKGQGNLFKDVAVDRNGFITMLDSNLGKIFEYTPEGDFVFVYGAIGNQEGLFGKPEAIAKLGDKTLVLDTTYGTITVFDLTDYGKELHEGIILYDEGLYTEAEDYWQSILKQNANCELAHIGLGKVYYQYGRYKDALHHFKVANDRTNYQDAFSLYREQLISNSFSIVMTLLVVLVLLLILLRIFGKKIITAIKNKKQGGGTDERSDDVE